MKFVRHMSLARVNSLLSDPAALDPHTLRAARRRLEIITRLIAGKVGGIDGRGDRSLPDRKSEARAA